jgi:phospholipid/cholesterol/gamma-HCH transport system substrate-binding protein
MKESNHAIRVGAFVVLALCLLGTLLLVFSKGLHWFTPSYTLRLRAANVGGLKSNSSVLVSGVAVGRVVATELSPDGRGVTILLRIQKRYRIHRDARFVVEQVGLLGDQFVLIYPTQNRAPPLEDNDQVECAPPFNLQEVTRSTAEFIRRIDQTTRILNDAIDRVNNVVLSERTLTNLSMGLQNFRQVSDRVSSMADRLDLLLASNSAPINVAVTNLVAFTESLNQLGREVNETLRENRGGISNAVKGLEESSDHFRQLTHDLEAGKGPFGSLLRDQQTQINLSNALVNLAAATSNMANYGLLYKPRKPPRR